MNTFHWLVRKCNLSLGGTTMVSHPRNFTLLLTILVLTGLLFGLLDPSPVRADIGVQPIFPGGSNIQPEAQTPIQMASELVTITVRQATAADNDILQLNPDAYGLQFQTIWYSYIAEVSAAFTMHNPTTQTISLTTWFPLASTLQSLSWELNPDEIVPRIASFQVVVDGATLNYTSSELPNPKGADRLPLPWASFPVTFPAENDTQIHIRYLLPLTMAVKGSELALYYVFQTGAGWAGAIGQAELVVNLPYAASNDTLVRVLPDHFSVPYSSPDIASAVPSGAVMEGNQVHWIWTDFEPTANDDFSAWLLNPGLWQQLEAAKTTVESNPQEGQAWLTLADVYRAISVRSYGFPSIFSESYLPLGLEAYQKAADLLPDHPAPHIGLALLTLAQYMRSVDIPPEVMQFLQDELQLAQELETLHPELADENNLTSWWLVDALDLYNYYVTATAQAVSTTTASDNQTESAALILTPMATPAHPSTFNPTAQPPLSPSLQPLLPTPTIATTAEPESVLGGNQLELILAVAAVVIILFVALYLGRRGLRRN